MKNNEHKGVNKISLSAGKESKFKKRSCTWLLPLPPLVKNPGLYYYPLELVKEDI